MVSRPAPSRSGSGNQILRPRGRGTGRGGGSHPPSPNGTSGRTLIHALGCPGLDPGHPKQRENRTLSPKRGQGSKTSQVGSGRPRREEPFLPYICLVADGTAVDLAGPFRAECSTAWLADSRARALLV